MTFGKERWSCVFVDQIIDKKIISSSPQKFGKMYTSSDNYRNKYRYSLPKKIGPISGDSNKNKLIKAISITIGLNRNDLVESPGLVLRGHKGYHSVVASYSEYVDPHTKEKIIKGTTDWLIYISPQLELFSITDDRRIGLKLDIVIENSVNECIKEIQQDWKR